MGSELIDGIVRRATRNRLLLSLLILILAVGAAYLARNTYYNLFSGPFPVKARDVAKITELNDISQYYITVEGDETFDTGYQRVRTRYGIETGHESFAALVVDDHLLLLEVPGDVNDRTTSYTGALVPMPSDVKREVLNDMLTEYPDLEDMFLPFMLDTSDFRTINYVGLAACIIAGLVGLWGIFKALGYMSNPDNHPIKRTLGLFGEADTVANQIEYELSQEHPIVAKVHLTRNWMVSYTGSSLKATQLSDIVWLYHKITKGRYGSKTFEAMVYDKHGSVIALKAKENEVKAILTAIAQRTPWAVMGHKAEIENAWKKDRQGFLAAVEVRKKQATSAQ